MFFEFFEMELKFIKVLIEVMDVVIKVFDVFVGFFSNMKDAVEFGKIGRYYVVESMLVMNDDGKYDVVVMLSYGLDIFKEFFDKVSKEGFVG